MAKWVGFVIDGRIPAWGLVLRGQCGPRALWSGWPSGSAVAVMRYGWIAAEINRQQSVLGLQYELYRPWRRYDVVVFLKSMGPASQGLLQDLQRKSTVCIFDANVDYYTAAAGTFYYEGMAPTEQQRRDAVTMTAACAGVIADSEHIAASCRTFNPKVCWIPDNVEMRRVPPPRVDSETRAGGRLTLLWSGEAVKLFELLSIGTVLEKYARHLRLVLITSDLAALERWRPEYRARFDALLRGVEHSIEPFQSLGLLQARYARGGVFIAPRFLDNTYNLGHTEWKITLAMACGRLAVCSPQPSYLTVARRAGGQGIRVCASAPEWDAAFDALLSGRVDLAAEGAAARAVVNAYYSTAVVAKQHADFVRGLTEQ